MKPIQHPPLPTKIIRVVERKNVWFGISGTIVLIALGLMGYRFFTQSPVLNFGIDFTGGTAMLLAAPEIQSVSDSDTTAKIRPALGPDLSDSVIQITSDHRILIKTRPLSVAHREQIIKNLDEKLGKIEVLEVDIIGPTIGSELRQKSALILLTVLGALLAYISWRFEFAYGLGALGSLLHDLILIVAIGSIFKFEINTEFIAAILTVLGYSINDTIVVFDRIRENSGLMAKGTTFAQLINSSIIQTFNRTINTVVTVLLVLISLIALGGPTIHGFAVILFIGICIGTYSSIFIASPILYIAGKTNHPSN